MVTPADDPEAPPPRNWLALWVGGLALLAIVIIGAGVVILVGGVREAASPTAGPRAQLATLPASAVARALPPDVTAQARACPALPGGSPSGYLQVAAATSGIGVDPLSGLETQFVAVRLASQPPAVGIGYTVAVVILPFGATAPTASGPPIDRAGTVQVIGFWDGGSWHRGLRTWSGTAWSTVADLAASEVDVAGGGGTVTLYWQGLGSGARFGVVTADGGGCATHDLDANLLPVQTYAG